MVQTKYTTSKIWLVIIGSLITSTYMIPYIIMGEDMFINDHDFLDSHQAYLKVLKDNDMLWSINGFFPSMEGVPLSGFDSLYPLRLLIYDLFEPYTAFVIGDWIARIIGFTGMFLLLDFYANNERRKQLVALLCAILFGILWFHDGYFELGSAGYPLLFYNFLCLRDNKHIKLSFLSLVFIASFSSIFHLTFFACIILLGYFIMLYCKYKIFLKNYFYGLCILTLSSICFSYNTIFNFLFANEVSHRVEFQTGLDLISSMLGSITLLLKTQYHTGVLISIPIIIMVLILFIREKRLSKRISTLSILIICIVLFYGIYQYIKYSFPEFTIIQMFQADRFYFMLPTLWICMLYFIIIDLNKTLIAKLVSTILTSLFIVGILYCNPECKALIYKIKENYSYMPTYRQFYDEALFCEIKKDIPEHSKTCAVGLYPSILSYNGFYTLDGYYVSYPLEYKYKFRKIIENELEKSDGLKRYFDKWGSRCYIFSSELGRNFLLGKNCDRTIKKLDINMDALKDMGCQYIFSSVPIENIDELNITPVKSYSKKDSYWKIYVYKI